MPEFKLRPAVREDFRHIRSLVWKAHLNPSRLDWNRFTVAVDQKGMVIGCVQLKSHQDGSIELASLVTAPAWQGQGVASALIRHLQASHNGLLYLMCGSALGSFYRQYGFETLSVDQMPLYFRRIKRLTGIVENLRKVGELLLVMRWQPEAPGSLHTPPAL